MVLTGVKKKDGWLMSRWQLTYGVSWEGLCKAVCSLYQSYESPELLLGGNKREISNKESILKLPEDSSLVIRGISKVVGLPLMITFYNQLKDVDVSIIAEGKEFSKVDYEKFNKVLGSFMDSVELAMYK